MLDDKTKFKGQLFIKVQHCKGLVNADSKMSGLSDPFVKIVYPDKSSKETKEISNCLNPIFD